MLNLNKRAWYARWFLLWNRCWAEFTDGRGVLGDNGHTNLCTYFWVSVGAPVFILGAHLAVLALALYATVYYGITRLTPVGFVFEVASIIALVALAYGAARLFEWIQRRPSKPAKIKPVREKKPSLIFAYAKAVHQRTCPIITLED